jgi:hypothetical protein
MRKRFMTDNQSKEEWLALCHSEAKLIDPMTAEMHWVYRNTFDPYGLDPDLPDEYSSQEKTLFARRPGSHVWVCFDDLRRRERSTVETLQ